MKIRLLTLTQKTPAWLFAGYDEYAKRLPILEKIEIPTEKRSPHSDIKRIVQQEGKKLLAAIKPNHCVIALDVKGELWSTEELAKHLAHWQQDGRTIDLLVGGPDGLSDECLTKAELTWSLSKLTFPHFFIPVIVAEQLYRADRILQNHPYHRK